MAPVTIKKMEQLQPDIKLRICQNVMCIQEEKRCHIRCNQDEIRNKIGKFLWNIDGIFIKVMWSCLSQRLFRRGQHAAQTKQKLRKMNSVTTVIMYWTFLNKGLHQIIIFCDNCLCGNTEIRLASAINHLSKLPQ